MTETQVAPEPEKGILSLTKKSLSMAEEYDVFDDQIIMHINSVFADLTQLGVGPVDGFEIEDDTAKWSDFLGTDKRLNGAKSYMYLRVRRLFDPPQVGFVLTAMDAEIEKWEWRLNVAVDTQPLTTTTDPTVTDVVIT